MEECPHTWSLLREVSFGVLELLEGGTALHLVPLIRKNRGTFVLGPWLAAPALRGSTESRDTCRVFLVLMSQEKELKQMHGEESVRAVYLGMRTCLRMGVDWGLGKAGHLGLFTQHTSLELVFCGFFSPMPCF